MDWHRLAAYHLPGGELGDWGAAWLGWDPRRGVEVVQPKLTGLPLSVRDLTATPRRYGFHATIKAPFRLAAGASIDDALASLRRIASEYSPFAMPLQLFDDWGILCLRPATQPDALQRLERALVHGLDHLRAPLTTDEIARRDPARLTPEGRANLTAWGYPHVLGLFQYHLTLSGALPTSELRAAKAALQPVMNRLLTRPMQLRSIALLGEDAAGHFHVIEDVPLGL